MDLFEYQGKQYFKRYGIPVSDGGIAATVEEAVDQAAIVGYPVVLKAQVRVGGRGKAGGVKLASNQDEVVRNASSILGMDIKGHKVHRLWIEHATDIKKEYYASVTLNRSEKCNMIMLSAKGGIDIEQVAHDDQNAVIKLNVNPLEGLSLDQARQTAEEAMLDAQAIEQTALFLCSLYRCYTEGDCDLVEVNPLVLTTDDKVHALDAKVTLDDSAAFRHEEWAEFDQDEDSDPREIAARQKGLNYVGLAGNVGIIANGAGLAMSTLDVVSQAGGEPANFLDIGGGANADTMAAALEVINSDPNVKVIFVNIFGGITRCDEVAKGIVEALSRVRLNSPIVLRLDGTNAQIGRDILEDHLSENFITVPTMLGAADKVVELTKEAM